MSILSHSMSHTTSPNTSSHSYLPSEENPITVQAGHSTNGKIVKESFFIEEEDSSDSPSRVSKQLINQIQLLDYKKPTILDEFKATLKQHITFRQVIPQMISKVGQKLIQDGLFHQMWRKANSKDSCYFQCYYQHFISKITANHSCFQNTFNQYYSEDEFPCKKQAQQDSNTRLTSKRYNKLKSQVLQSSLLQSSKENEQIHYSIESPSDRLRLIDEIQTNKRRLNAEMVCYFLGIKKFYRLTEMEIVSVLQFYHSQNKEVLILQAHEPTFCKAVDKIAIDYHPKIYIAMYGFISLTMLLRIKRQYSPIEGFILYEELLSLPLWLKNNGIIASTSQ